MNEDTSVKTPGFFLPIAIALVGVVLGAVAIYLAVSGSGEMKDDITRQLKEATNKVATYDQRLADLEERVRIASEANNTTMMKARSLEEGVVKLVSQTQTVLNQLAGEIAALKTGGQAQATATAAAPARATETAAEPTATAAAEQPAAPAPTQGDTYVVKAGDTFTKIARSLGVSVEAVEKANPNVSSNRLQVGQKINVPAKQ